MNAASDIVVSTLPRLACRTRTPACGETTEAVPGAVLICKLDLPDAVAAVPARLLHDTRLAGCQALRQFPLHRRECRIVARVAAPSHGPRAKEYVLGTHLRDHVGMGADEHAGGCDVGQHLVQVHPVATIDDGIDPDQDAVDAHELLAQPLDIVGNIGRSLDRDALFGKRRSSPGKAGILQSGLLSPLRIGRKHDRHSIR